MILEPIKDTKYCSGCNKVKPISEFHRRRRNKDGLVYTCKICRQNETLKYRLKYRDLINKRKRESYHRDKYKNRHKRHAYYLRNKEHFLSKSEIQRYGRNRQNILERDGFKCQICGSNKKLAIHHVDGKGTTVPTAERNNNLENLMTVCSLCHIRLHIGKGQLNGQ